MSRLLRTFAAILLLIVSSTTVFAGEFNVVRLATTTSTDNSGLLKQLLPPFEQRHGIKVHVIAVGTGKALRMGRDGDVDVVLVHAPAAEHKFVDDGHGVGRRDVMYNDFVIVGPDSDPAKVRNSQQVTKALAAIANSKSIFISRGDDSGTHKKELALWRASGITPTGSWYREAGQGMGKVLLMSTELNGYTLTDRGTWLAMKARLGGTTLLVQGDKRLHNPYGIIAVNPGKYPDVNHRGANALINWVTSKTGRSIIDNFRVDGKRLFTPSEALARNNN